ncbi:hypothetical protein Gogos_010238, partial [Gossypium gossypioides]|nr:hypothetical protein [Gossypium gossypioides]
ISRLKNQDKYLQRYVQATKHGLLQQVFELRKHWKIKFICRWNYTARSIVQHAKNHMRFASHA